MNKFYSYENELKVYNFSEELYWMVINDEVSVDDALSLVSDTESYVKGGRNKDE